MTSPDQSPTQLAPHSTAIMGRSIWGEIGWTLVRMICFALILGNIAMFGKSMLFFGFTPDNPWLLRTGQYILEHGHIPTHDIFSWTFPDKAWTVYQWLFEVGYAFIYNTLGHSMSFRLFIVLMVGLYVILPYLHGQKRGIPAVFLLLISSSALYLSAVNTSLRPMIATTGCLAFQYLLIDGYRLGKYSLKRLFIALFVLYALWGNMHTGVTIGFLSLIAWVFGDLWQRQNLKDVQPSDHTIEGSPKPWRHYGLMIGIGFMGSLLNPYGIGIYQYLAELASQHYLNSVIIELQSPNFHMMNYWYLAGFIVVIMGLMTQGNRVFSGAERAHLLLFTLATLLVQRFVVWSALLYALILPKALYQFWKTYWDSPTKEAHPFVEGFNIYKPLFFLLISLASIGLLVWPAHKLPTQYGVCDPVMKGIQAYLKVKRVDDKPFMDPEIGSCLLLASSREKIFFDTRFDFYQQTFTQSVRNVTLLVKETEPFMEKWGITLVLLSKNYPLPILLNELPQYQKIYEDNKVILFRRQPLSSKGQHPSPNNPI